MVGDYENMMAGAGLKFPSLIMYTGIILKQPCTGRSLSILGQHNYLHQRHMLLKTSLHLEGGTPSSLTLYGVVPMSPALEQTIEAAPIRAGTGSAHCRPTSHVDVS